MRPAQLASLSCLLVITLSACKPESAENMPAVAATEKADVSTEPASDKPDGLFNGIFSSEPEPAKLDLAKFKLLEVNLGTAVDSDNLVTKPATQFRKKDKIYASVLSNGPHQGLTIKARWTAPDGSLVAETEQALVPVKGTVSTFSISNNEAWPVGVYTLEVSLNDLVQRTVSFEVK